MPLLLFCLLLVAGRPVLSAPTPAPSFSVAPSSSLRPSVSKATSAAPTTLQGEILIDVFEKWQRVQGFGASGAWWAQDVGGWEDNETRDRIVELLFDAKVGIGLSIYRYNIGGGENPMIGDSWRQAETFEVAPREYDWSRDANAIWVLKAAQAAGVEQFVAFANSPPARMTMSGRTNGDTSNKTLSNLDPEMYDEFAQYLVDVVTHLQEEEGVPIGWLSPINEPQWEWQVRSGQEGCHYEPKEAAEMTKAMIRAVEASEVDVHISVFEGGEWDKSSVQYVAPLLDDPKIAVHVDHLAIHSYWSSPDAKKRFIRYLDQNYPNIPIEMTEWTEMKRGRDVTMDPGLVLANTIHDDLVLGRVISWQYWIAVSKYSYCDGLIYVNIDSHELTETKRLWVMGNYSRFVRPGFQRVGVKISLQHDLKATAFLSPDGEELVVVVINNSRDTSKVGLREVSADFVHMEVFETSAEQDLAEVFLGYPPKEYAFPAESVTTLIYHE